MKDSKIIKLGGHRYLIQETYVPRAMESSNDGYLDRDMGIIYISEGLMPSEKDATLIHEIIHQLNNEISHETVDSLAQQLYQVLIENHLWNSPFQQ